MAENIEVVDSPLKVAVGVSDYVFRWNLGSYIKESYKLIEEEMKKANSDFSGIHYARFSMFNPLFTHVEVGIQVGADNPLFQGFDLPKPLRRLEVPACKAATMWHVGTYDKLASVWKGFCPSIQAQGHHLGSVCWEEYHTSYEEEPDESKHQTRLFCAVMDTNAAP